MMKKLSLTHKLLAVALAFVLVAVSLPDYLSFAQQPAQEQSETDEFETIWPTAIRLMTICLVTIRLTPKTEMEQQVVLHLQAPETVPMGDGGKFGLSAQNTAAVAAVFLFRLLAADVSYPADTGEMAAYQAAEQDSTLALQPVGDSLTFTLQPGTDGGDTQLPLPTATAAGRWWRLPRGTSRLSCSSSQKKKLEAPRSKPSLPKAKFSRRSRDRRRQRMRHSSPAGRGRPILRMEGKQLHQNPVMGRKQPTLRTERMKPFRQNPAMERK